METPWDGQNPVFFQLAISNPRDVRVDADKKTQLGHSKFTHGFQGRVIVRFRQQLVECRHE